MVGYRTEKDSLGEVKVPAEARWGAQTQRAIQNFPILRPLPIAFIRAIARIKWCAARVNHDLGLLPAAHRDAICTAAEAIVLGEYDSQFPVDIFQTGSGTSSNMNVNEVIASLCLEQGVEVHPNDQINLGQSSNDVIPTAIHLATVQAITNQLLPAVSALRQATQTRAEELADVVKTGRTHLMDAMPMTLGQELGGWAAQLAHAEEALKQARDGLLKIPQGGTAVGTGVNAHPEFAARFARLLSEKCGYNFEPMDSFFSGQSAMDRPLAASAALRALATVLMKISNDLRWMNSGPINGLAEIQLPAVQPGSSIMPGKVNPVICESVAMISAQVTGLDQAICIAAQSGNFQLNVMLPLIANNLLEMTTMLANGAAILRSDAINGFSVNSEHLNQAVSRNPILVTALNPLIGYEKAAEIAKQAFASGRPVIDVAEEMTDLPRDELNRILAPERLTRGG